MSNIEALKKKDNGGIHFRRRIIMGEYYISEGKTSCFAHGDIRGYT